MRPPADAARYFDDKYQADEDPWRYRDSWYERRKYAITLASLPRSSYSSGWEPGCSIGELTALLASRVQRLDASDLSATAVAVARATARELTGVRVDQARLPDPPPRLGYDLIVLSEVLYYLPDDAREATLAVVEQVAAPGADVVVVHWRQHPEDAWAAGESVNRALRGRPGWRPLVRHDDVDFVLDVFALR